MKQISVPFRSGHLVLSIAEARTLTEDLHAAIERAQHSIEALGAPTLVDDRFITLDGLYEFFVQLYPDRAALRNHAGKLFGRITEVARRNQVAFNVICTQCNLHVSNQCAGNNYLHMSNHRNMKIEVVTLKEHADQFMTSGFRLVGPAMCNDLKILLNYL